MVLFFYKKRITAGLFVQVVEEARRKVQVEAKNFSFGLTIFHPKNKNFFLLNMHCVVIYKRDSQVMKFPIRKFPNMRVQATAHVENGLESVPKLAQHIYREFKLKK